MTLKAGWLKRQMDHVSADVENWPEWMKREAIFSAHSTEDARRCDEDAPESQTAPCNSTASGAED